ncbi:hypothetical protein [Bosea psychrotolerans]|uniref:Uncharacterized protein n=1 Tax=Bosea psychrotolerans TaxID=1871628 RepID=A0A2S4M3R1_9HYPH|nr:hypothetical protein [Bosea psychrotolerans]POR49334.1 hypothetical protein CYD53_112159 [Bosea psychrotolerans]
MKVFWSWQSDRPAKYCRDVVQTALQRALDALSDELELEPSEAELDHDTKGEAGMAAIADTILQKIEQAGVFVGDITSAGRSESGRELPNPNVLIELGWAWAHLSHENIILVANKFYGPSSHEKLPFDIRHRRAAILYSLAKGADDAAIEAATAKLTEDLKSALRKSLDSWLVGKSNDPGPSGTAARSGDPSVWFEADQLLQHQPFHGGNGLQDVEPEEGRRSYVRIVPERFSNGIPASAKVHAGSATSGLRPLGPHTSGDGGLNPDGVLRYGADDGSNPTVTRTATQWFRETGELWTFDTKRLNDGTFYIAHFLTDVASFLVRGLSTLSALGGSGLIRIEVGAVGLKGSQWGGQFEHERSSALIDRVKVSEARRSWSKAEIAAFLVTVTEHFDEAYGNKGPNAQSIMRMVDAL